MVPRLSFLLRNTILLFHGKKNLRGKEVENVAEDAYGNKTAVRKGCHKPLHRSLPRKFKWCACMSAVSGERGGLRVDVLLHVISWTAAIS